MEKQEIQNHQDYYNFLIAQEDEKIGKEYVSLCNSNMYLGRKERQEKKAIIESILEERGINLDLSLKGNGYYVFKGIIIKTKEKVFDLIQA